MNVLLLCSYLEGNAVSEHCKSLAKYLSENNVEAHIVGFSNKTSDSESNPHIHAVNFILNGNNLFNWTMLMNNELKRKGREIFEERGLDIIHAHDWMTAAAGMSLTKLTEKPLVVTIHSTEHQRGFYFQHSPIISSLEWWASYEAPKVIVNNEFTYESVRYDLNLPKEKICKINPLSDGWQQKVLEVYRELSM